MYELQLCSGGGGEGVGVRRRETPRHSCIKLALILCQRLANSSKVEASQWPPWQGNVLKKNIHKKGRYMGKFRACLCFISLWYDIPYEIVHTKTMDSVFRALWLAIQSVNILALFTDSPPVPPSERRQTRISCEQNAFPVCWRNKQRNFTTNQANCSRNTRRRWRSSGWKF